MTIDEAISREMDEYREYRVSNPKCAQDHYQLAYWLTESEIVKRENVQLRKMLRLYTFLVPALVAVQTSAIAVLVIKILKLKGAI